MTGKPWYNNGIEEIQRNSNEQIPDGFIPGRLPKTEREKEISKLKYKNTMNNKSQEERDAINQKRSDSLKQTYLNKSDEEKKLIIQKRMTTMNNKSDEEKELYKQKLSLSLQGKNAGKEPWNRGLTKDTDGRVLKNAQHTSDTNKKKAQELKEKDPQYFNKWRNEISKKMRQNGTFNSSKIEEEIYKDLINQYGKENVIRQYKEKRYPFDCDFYIPSEDLFIEVNKHWSHGGHPFDENNLDDIFQLEFWQEQAEYSKYYKNAIYVWTDLDVRKQKIAKQNHLNYKTIY